jgi:polyisoprenoid-binding protein YceI
MIGASPRVHMHNHARHWLGLLLLCLGITAVLAADGAINLKQSSLVATFKQQHAPVEAAFKKFSGSIVYDAAKPAAAVASLSVDMSSLDIGDADTEAEVLKPAWFDSAHYPQATFRATTITPRASGGFDASGPLTIKGKTHAITVAVTVQRSGGANAFDGSFELSRKAFDIGDPAWQGVLDDEVLVRFHFVVAGP